MTRQYDNYAELITFSRSSSGTALRPVSYGDELVTNGDFDSDVSGWPTIAAVSPTWDAGRLSQVHDYQSTGAYQTFSTTVGKIYEATGTLVSSSLFTSNFLLRAGNGTAPNAGLVDSESISSNNTTVSVVFVATGTTSYVYLRGDSGATSVWDNVSVKEVLFDQPNAPLTLFNHPAGIPRIEYDADGNVLGLLVEESRTNLLPYSEDFSNAAWIKSGSTVTASEADAPDGTKSAYEVDLNSGGTIYESVIVAAVAHTFSVWLRADESGQIRLARTNLGSDGVDVNVTTEWKRFDVVITPTTTNDGPQVRRNNAGQLSKVYIWGAQLEAGAFPTSYIPTSGSTATRAADVASIPVSAFGYNQSEGTVVVEGLRFGTSAVFPRIASINDGTTSNEIYATIFGSTNQAVTHVVLGGTVETTLSPVTIGAGLFAKIARSYKNNSSYPAINGVAQAEDTTVSIPSGLSQVNIGQRPASAEYLNGYIKSIKYYPRALTAAQLQELTT